MKVSRWDSGEAAAILAKANTRLKSSLFVAKSLKKQYGIDAASLVIAEHYANAFSKLAKTGNTVLLPTKWKIYQVWLIKKSRNSLRFQKKKV
ncbi:uncharacterized protein LOC143240742 isoform X6 [Tachypleus tridentatus]|uniref:uncharacterized protein LOC143240742 isoform X6 n=1 Tax=Tachypleus tridentatus TaxID=6853 RepID=UPI003FD18F4E